MGFGMLGLGGVLADLMIKPTSSPVFGKPSDFDLSYEDVEFKASDDVTVRGWLVNPGQGKVIVQTHFGVQCSRSGWYRDDKGFMGKALYHESVVFMEHIKHLANAGYTVLAYDMRHHGESDPGSNQFICDGQEEAKDVIAAVKFITSHKDYSTASIGLLSLCMGSSATVNAFSLENGLKGIPNLKTMLAIQPHYSYLFLQKYGMPTMLVNAAAANVQSRAKINFKKSPVESVPHVDVPTLVMQNENDPYHDKGFVEEWYEALTVEKKMLWIDSGKTRFHGYAYFGREPAEMLEWFAKYL